MVACNCRQPSEQSRYPNFKDLCHLLHSPQHHVKIMDALSQMYRVDLWVDQSITWNSMDKQLKEQGRIGNCIQVNGQTLLLQQLFEKARWSQFQGAFLLIECVQVCIYKWMFSTIRYLINTFLSTHKAFGSLE